MNVPFFSVLSKKPRKEANSKATFFPTDEDLGVDAGERHARVVHIVDNGSDHVNVNLNAVHSGAEQPRIGT